MTDWYSLYRTRPARQFYERRFRDSSGQYYYPLFNWDLSHLPNGGAITQQFRRQGEVDTRQPVWGGFSGGGWAL